MARTGKWNKEADAWVADLKDLDDEDTVYVQSNGLVLKAGAAKRAAWREFNIPKDKVVVVHWADGSPATPSDKINAMSNVGGYTDIVAVVAIIILLLIAAKILGAY